MSQNDAANESADDRHDLPRQPTGQYFRVLNAATGDLLGEVENLSPQGMGLLTDRELTVGDRIGVNVEWTDSAGTAKTFALIVACRWVSPDDAPGRWQAGLEVVDMNPVQRMALKIMVANFVEKGGT